MEIKLSYPLAEKDVYLDGYVVMKSGMKTYRAVRKITAPELLEQLQNRFSFYHFWPLTNSLGEKKETPPLYDIRGGIGGLAEDGFSKQGLALVMDDKISTGATINKALNYIRLLGYCDDEIWILAEVYFPPPKGEMWGRWDYKLERAKDFFT
ncbi:MAG: hypothetical protein ABFS45_07315 [Pseudomonadota bacterium]